MYKNIITILISCFIGLLLAYIGGIFYFHINLNKERPYHFKNLKTLKFHKVYTEKLHHLKWLNRTTKENVIDEDFLFSTVNSFNGKKYKVLIQGDSYVETLTYYKKTHNLLKDFSYNNNVGLINAGVGSYAPSLMNLQLDILEKDFNIYPNVIVAYFDQSDMGDEICRYKNKKIFNDKNELIKVKEEKYSRNIFNYTKLHEESSVLLSKKSNFRKSLDLLNFNIKYSYHKQKNKILFKMKGIKEKGFKGRKLKKECTWNDIERPLVENNPNEILYFKKQIENYLDKVSEKKHIKKVFIVTFPHRANLYPLKNQFNQMIYYNVNLADIIENIIKKRDGIEHLNFTKEIKGNEKYFYDNAYIDFDPHLKEDFHYSLFAKTIVEKLEASLNKN